MQNLTQEFLQHLLHYDPLTGIWTWMNPLLRSKMKRGDAAGRITHDGRRQIRIASGFYYSSRLACLYMTGEWPAAQVRDKALQDWAGPFALIPERKVS